MKTCLITGSDFNYIKYAKALIRSCKEHAPCIDTIYRYIAKEPTETVEQYADEIIFDKCMLSEKRSIARGKFDIDHPKNKSNNILDRLISPKSLYCTHVKYSNCKYALMSGYDRVIVSDADTIIRGDVSRALDRDRFNSCDIAMKMTTSLVTNEYNFNVCYEEGFFVVNNTTRSNEFIDEILLQLKKQNQNNTIHVDSDTIIIGNILNKGDSINIVELPACLKDEKLNDKSLVWSGRGGAKDNIKFTTVVDRYNEKN